MKKRYLNAKEAADLLGISMSTLYSYVSRGLIRSETLDADSRQHRYYAEDVQKLRSRHEQRKNPAKAAQDAMHWGTPILESALTLITDNHVYYRGYSALELAVTHHFEEVVSLLWQGDLALADKLRSQDVSLDQDIFLNEDLPFIPKLMVVLARASARDVQAYNLAPDGVIRTGTRILRLMATSLSGGQAMKGLSIAEMLGAAWCPDQEVVPLLDAALTLCADHELNASSFAARVVASAEAHPYAVVLAGLSALQGFQHGGNIYRVEALLQDSQQTESPDRLIAQRLQRGERIPGFGHRLYPDGDPRAKTLLGLLADYDVQSTALQQSTQLIDVVRNMLGLEPNIDFALCTLQQVLDLPSGAALSLFGLGRTAGWIGHALEQYAQHTLIRPRATYSGSPPRSQKSRMSE